MGTGNSRYFTNTSGARMPVLPAFFGRNTDFETDINYIKQFVKGFIKWSKLKLLLNEKAHVLRKSKYGFTITVVNVDLINQINLFELGRNSTDDLRDWVYVIMNSDVFNFVTEEELILKECLSAMLNTEKIDIVFLQTLLRRLK